jgi:hypothetical protein
MSLFGKPHASDSTGDLDMQTVIRGLMTLTVLAISASSQAGPIGLCVLPGYPGGGPACNKYFFNLSAKSVDTLALDGYEYGCAAPDRLATGVMRFRDNKWYIGFVGSNAQEWSEFGQTVTWSGHVSADTNVGVYRVFYAPGDFGVKDEFLEIRACIDPGMNVQPSSTQSEPRDTTRR